MQPQTQGGHGVVEAVARTAACGDLGPIDGPCNAGAVGEQHAAFLKRLAYGGHIQGGGLQHVQLLVGLPQAGAQQLRVLVEVLLGLQLCIVRVDLTPRKHIGSAQHVRQAVAAHHKHLEPGRAVAQHDHSGGRARRSGWGRGSGLVCHRVFV